MTDRENVRNEERSSEEKEELKIKKRAQNKINYRETLERRIMMNGASVFRE